MYFLPHLPESTSDQTTLTADPPQHLQSGLLLQNTMHLLLRKYNSTVSVPAAYIAGSPALSISHHPTEVY